MTTDLRAAIDDAVRRIRHDGFTILEGVIPADRVEPVRVEAVAALQRGYWHADLPDAVKPLYRHWVADGGPVAGGGPQGGAP